MRQDVVNAAIAPAPALVPPSGLPVVAHRLSRLDTALAFALGFCLQFNVITATFGLPFMRLSDIVPFVLIPYFCLRTDFIARAFDNAARIGLVLVLLTASVILKAERGPGDIYMTLILMVYFVQALQILTVFGELLLTALCVGTLTGYVGSLAVLIAAGLGWNLEAFGLAVPADPTLTLEQLAFVQDKLGGLWAGGNQTGHVFAAAGAAALLLSFQLKTRMIYLLYFLGLMVSFPITNNRAGLIVPLVGLLVIVWRDLKYWHLVVTASIVGLFLFYAGVTGIYLLPDSLGAALESRLYSDNQLGNNISERLNSGFEAMGLMVRNPFGIGNVALENELLAATGVPTPHNGILALGLQSGILIALIYVVGLVQILIGRSRRYGSFLLVTVLFSTLSMFFEQLTAAQYFLFLIALVLAAWAVRGSRPQTLPHSGAATG